MSNLSVYREKLGELMETGRIKKLITSIDAGTRETFKKIKKNDKFDSVVENMRKYPLDKTIFYLKYLFLPGYNDNEKDVDGFYEIAKKAGAIVKISVDNKTNAKPFTEDDRLRALTIRLIDKAKADGIRIATSENAVHPKDAKFIRDYYQNT